MYYNICFVIALAFIDVALSTAASFNIPEPLLLSCNLGDMECLKKSTEIFVKNTHNGIPAYNIVPTDPLIIPSLDVALESGNLHYENRNIVVKGLEYQKLHAFQMDVTTGSVVLKTSADVNIEGDVTRVAPDVSKNMAGHFWSYGHVLGTATYSYTLQTDDKGVEHFVVGPETISCQLVDTPSVVFNPQSGALFNGAFSPVKMDELWEKNFCKIVEKAYVSVVHNIRAAAKVLPSSAFFKNLYGH